MKCRECGSELDRLDNEHLLGCCGLTVHEYAIRHHQPLELLLSPSQIDAAEEPSVCPEPVGVPGEGARAVLLGLTWAGLVRRREGMVEIPGEVRRLDLLLWALGHLRDYGFRFRQEYSYAGASHRVVARNLLRVPAARLQHTGPRAVAVEPPPDFYQALAVLVAHCGESQAGYLFLPFADADAGREAATRLYRDHGVRCIELDAADQPGGLLLRTATLRDAEGLLHLLSARLREMPGAWERFTDPSPEATVTKELVFDAAHFITDHPAKCSNLHGGRYLLQVQVAGRIDPATGCVVDYGYLKRVVNRLVVERFDHHTLNYAAPELAWRSSTEMICVHVWECLIDYLPGLAGLRLYETTQSWCDYRGPTLAEHQARGTSSLLTHFQTLDATRPRLGLIGPAGLRAVSGRTA
jgi:6-pyruvoyl tetrahydropterin synthase/QueD family protein